ncbi:hypothetical protein AXF42_Ash011724 [Apostasia shenzhenica]|uniref:Uncharacterized protein n=1 Tax=Apostasia shenzhenica TaxID=1088818 RepID=A0A2H9ZUT7_9ASPA|nr:hypothetical protein AXF42_Ash011724 [Apostasia shenzhenica]
MWDRAVADIEICVLNYMCNFLNESDALNSFGEDSLKNNRLVGEEEAAIGGGDGARYLLVSYPLRRREQSAGNAVVAAAAPWIFFLVPQLIPAALCSCNVILLIITGTALMLLILVWQPHLQILSVSSLSRYNDGGRLSDQQMALLQYQRENLHYLSEEVLRLQELLSKYHRADDGTTPQVDLAHLLAARDQELRALSAEMNQVHSEIRLARSLIAEKDSEIQGYIEENERLRAILGEWSSRAAKVYVISG